MDKFERSKKYVDRAGLTVFLSSSLVAKAKARNINISEVTERTLEYLLEYGNSAEMIDLAVIEANIQDVHFKIQKHQEEIRGLENIRSILEQRKTKQQAMIDEMNRALEISQHIKSLNQVFLDTHFDLIAVKDLGKEHIAKLISLGFEINDEWLVRQSQRVKLMKQ